MSAVRRSRLVRLTAALGAAASLTFAVAGCTSASSSIELSADTVIVDVRTPDEFASGHLEGAISIDVQGTGFDAAIAELDRDAEYFVYCRSGNRAASAIDRMATLGFTSVENGGGLDQAAAATGLEIVG